MSRKIIAIIFTCGILSCLLSGCQSADNISSEPISREPSAVSELPEETVSVAPEVSSSGIPDNLENIYHGLVGVSIYLDTQDYQEVVDKFAEVLEAGARSLPSNSWYAVSDYILLEASYELDGERYDFEVDAQYFDVDVAFRGNFRMAVKPLNKIYYPLTGGDKYGEGE